MSSQESEESVRHIDDLAVKLRNAQNVNYQ